MQADMHLSFPLLQLHKECILYTLNLRALWYGELFLSLVLNNNKIEMDQTLTTLTSCHI